jgi:hypothetical protein
MWLARVESLCGARRMSVTYLGAAALGVARSAYQVATDGGVFRRIQPRSGNSKLMLLVPQCDARTYGLAIPGC